MGALPFIIFGIIFVILICAHFLPAYRAWWISRSQQVGDIDTGYVRFENYFARSFRSKISEWVKLPPYKALPDCSRIIRKGKEYLHVSESATYPPRSQSDEILVVQGSFQCGAGCTFNREIYVSEDACVGDDCRMQAMAVDGKLILGAGVQIARWVDSSGELEIGPQSSVGARATSGRIIRLRRGSRVGSAWAAVVSTMLEESPSPEDIAEPWKPDLEITAQGEIKKLANAGLETKNLTRLSSNCFIYRGDLSPSVPINIRTSLVVKGDCILPPGSIVEGDLKARQLIVIGERSICKGNLVAEGNIQLGPGTRFAGVVHAGKKLQMSRGVRGGNGTTPVAAYAGESLLLAEDVIIHGKVAAAHGVTVTA